MSQTMPCPHKPEEDCNERGAALLIAIFALLLISVVGIALIVSTGTDSALTGNYRTSTSAYYAALAGLEEARGRLYRKDPNYINIAAPNFLTPQGTPALSLATVLYIINPNVAAGEAVVPYDLSNLATFPDTEYQTEFGIPPPTTALLVNSVSPDTTSSPPLPGQLFKWVRINAVTEFALQIHVNPSGSSFDSTDPLLYDPLNHDAFGNLSPSLIVPPNPPPSPAAEQALEITSLAVLPNGSRRLLQYIVAPTALNLTFPSVLTLDGNGVSFPGPSSSSVVINGNDGNNPFVSRSCSTPLLSPVWAIGYTYPGDAGNISAGSPPRPGNYTGAPPTPSFGPVTLPANFQRPSTLDGVVQTITENADILLSGPLNSSTFPTASTSTSPLTIVVNGDLDLTSWHHTGYGLLLVTGTLTYDPDAHWEGIVLVIGKGIFRGGHAGLGNIDGAMLVAQTHDSLGNLLPDPNLGPSLVDLSSMPGGLGIYYDSCWINRAQPPLTYKVLSFREIPLAN
ncbi:MAG TPA: pilus assembly PilX N-terminal domain-containing protein [Candidatus Acidoferrum sp.]|nr:pilus assembly PilX N-terminal domain-containing protein [Candidatus Acidoferrum sp.]